MLLTDYLKQNHKTIREIAAKIAMDESVLGKKIRARGGPLQYVTALKLGLATNGQVTFDELGQEYSVNRPKIFSGRLGERIAIACAEGEDLEERLIQIGINRRQLEYMLAKKPIPDEDRTKLRTAFRSTSIALTDRDFERHARGQ